LPPIFFLSSPIPLDEPLSVIALNPSPPFPHLVCLSLSQDLLAPPPTPPPPLPLLPPPLLLLLLLPPRSHPNRTNGVGRKHIVKIKILLRMGPRYARDAKKTSSSLRGHGRKKSRCLILKFMYRSAFCSCSGVSCSLLLGVLVFACTCSCSYVLSLVILVSVGLSFFVSALLSQAPAIHINPETTSKALLEKLYKLYKSDEKVKAFQLCVKLLMSVGLSLCLSVCLSLQLCWFKKEHFNLNTCHP
jgi:hypothetical protein